VFKTWKCVRISSYSSLIITGRQGKEEVTREERNRIQKGTEDDERRTALQNENRTKNFVFWDVTPYGSCENRRFGGTYRILHQGDKNG
jgi:hypothetical protein